MPTAGCRRRASHPYERLPLWRLQTHHAEPLEIWRLIKAKADLQGTPTLLLVSRQLCTVCRAMVDALAHRGAMWISARHDEEKLRPVFAQLAAAASASSVPGLSQKQPAKKRPAHPSEAQLLAALGDADDAYLSVEGFQELDAGLTSLSNAAREERAIDAAIAQLEQQQQQLEQQERQQYHPPPRPAKRPRPSEATGDADRYRGRAAVGAGMVGAAQAEENRAKQRVRAAAACRRHCARLRPAAR
jgi:hypothetical protein